MPMPNNKILLHAVENSLELVEGAGSGRGIDIVRDIGGRVDSLYGVSAPVPHGVDGSVPSRS
jgi:hypothetical protein